MSHVLIKMPQNLRNLSDDEIRQLKSQGCTAENWQTVRVAEPFLTERKEASRVRRLRANHVASTEPEFKTAPSATMGGSPMSAATSPPTTSAIAFSSKTSA
jgi:hypothetical protein